MNDNTTGLHDKNGNEFRIGDKVFDTMCGEPTDRFSVMRTPTRQLVILDEFFQEVYGNLHAGNCDVYEIVGTMTDDWSLITAEYPQYFKE